MSNRLNQKRQDTLEPSRVQHAINELSKRVFIIIATDAYIKFRFKEATIIYWPYSGWASGKTIKDGRGLKTLLKQIDKEILK